MNLNEVPKIKKSILRTEKIVLNSDYPDDSMNSSAIYFAFQKKQVQPYKSRIKNQKIPVFVYPNNINRLIRNHPCLSDNANYHPLSAVNFRIFIIFLAIDFQ